MAIKEPVKSSEEAFKEACRKNGINVNLNSDNRKKTRKYIHLINEKGEVILVNSDLVCKKSMLLTLIRKIKLKIKKRNKA